VDGVLAVSPFCFGQSEGFGVQDISKTFWPDDGQYRQRNAVSVSQCVAVPFFWICEVYVLQPHVSVVVLSNSRSLSRRASTRQTTPCSFHRPCSRSSSRSSPPSLPLRRTFQRVTSRCYGDLTAPICTSVFARGCQTVSSQA
jgi:hypothetical protein